MADQSFSVLNGVSKKIRDMGDSTFAEVVSATISRQVFTANIANAASLSSAVDLGNATAARIGLPATVTGSGTLTLTFQVSHDGVTYKDMYDAYGSEYTIAAGKATQGRSYLLPLADFGSVRYLKVRTGTSASPQAQGQSTDITITVVA